MSWLTWLYPIHTGRTFFDYWTMAHLSFWFLIGSTIAVMKTHRNMSLIMCVAVAYSWEAFERFAEKEWPNIWQSPESWYNSWISDPLTCVVAVLVAFYGYDKWRPK